MATVKTATVKTATVNPVKLRSGVTLAENEQLALEIEAELWASSSNPIAQFIGRIRRFFALILGFKMKSFLVITDKRVIEIKTLIACWCITTGRWVKYVLPSSVKEVGYKRLATCCCCCPMYVLYYEGHTQYTRVQLKGANEAAAVQAANAFYAAISHAQV